VGICKRGEKTKNYSENLREWFKVEGGRREAAKKWHKVFLIAGSL